MRAVLVQLRGERSGWTLVGIRTAIWAATAFTLLWAPLHGASVIPPFRAYESVTDLLFGTFAQWDSVWFLHIAEHGYDSKQITAFFPFYPLVVHGLAEVVRSTLVAGVLVSLAAGAVAAAVLARIARSVLGERTASDVVLFVALYPIAYVFTALYSDGLFLALAAGSFLAAQRRRSLQAGVLGGLAVGTRIVGLALLPALIVCSGREADTPGSTPGWRRSFCYPPRSAGTRST
jgi:Gpi18-like mannosyltransferase